MNTPARHQIQWSVRLWEGQRWYILVFLVLCVMEPILFVRQYHRLDNFALIYLALIPACLVLGGALLAYRLRHFARVDEDGLKVSTFLKSYTVDFEEIRGVKVQPLNVAFPNPKLLAPVHRPLLDKPALYVRVRPDDESALVERLGRRHYVDGHIVLPIKDPDKLALEINSRLPTKVPSNQGGRRKKKRG